MKNLIFLTILILLYSCKNQSDTNTTIDKKSILLKEVNNNIINKKLIFCYGIGVSESEFEKDYSNWLNKWQNRGGKIAKLYVINNNSYDIVIYSRCNSCFNAKKWFKDGKPNGSSPYEGRIANATKSFIKSKDSTIMYLNHSQYQADSLSFYFEWQKVGVDSIYEQEATMFKKNGKFKAHPTKYLGSSKLDDIYQYHYLDTNRYRQELQ